MPGGGVDAERLISTLHQHQVRFVVVGGFAVELWDVAVEPTVDVDITPEASKANLGRLAAALNELEAAIRVGTDTVQVPGGFTGEMLAQMTVLNLNTNSGPLDLTFQPAGFSGYAVMADDSSDIAYGEVMVPTASLSKVATSKESAGRAKDLMTLPAIRAHIARVNRST